MHRDGIRPRPIDDSKPLKVIRNINKEKEQMTQEELQKFSNLEGDLKAVIDNFSRIKSIITPQYQNLIINKNNKLNKNEGNSSNEKQSKIKMNSSENNEKEVSNASTEQSNTPIPKASFTQKDSVNSSLHSEKELTFTLQEFKRPESYIIYPSVCREERAKKGYEATQSDTVFLEYHNNFISVPELENLFTQFDLSIAHNSDCLNEEKAKMIVRETIGRKGEHEKKLIDFFSLKRQEHKMALLRSEWREQKFADKFLGVTFRRREREKMKTRKNTQNKRESLRRVSEDCELCMEDIQTILEALELKEKLKIFEARAGAWAVDGKLGIEKVSIEKIGNVNVGKIGSIYSSSGSGGNNIGNNVGNNNNNVNNNNNNNSNNVNISGNNNHPSLPPSTSTTLNSPPNSNPPILSSNPLPLNQQNTTQTSLNANAAAAAASSSSTRSKVFSSFEAELEETTRRVREFLGENEMRFNPRSSRKPPSLPSFSSSHLLHSPQSPQSQAEKDSKPQKNSKASLCVSVGAGGAAGNDTRRENGNGKGVQRENKKVSPQKCEGQEVEVEKFNKCLDDYSREVYLGLRRNNEKQKNEVNANSSIQKSKSYVTFSCLKFRIRRGKFGKFVIDRYIQKYHVSEKKKYSSKNNDNGCLSKGEENEKSNNIINTNNNIQINTNNTQTTNIQTNTNNNTPSTLLFSPSSCVYSLFDDSFNEEFEKFKMAKMGKKEDIERRSNVFLPSEPPTTKSPNATFNEPSSFDTLLGKYNMWIKDFECFGESEPENENELRIFGSNQRAFLKNKREKC